MFLMSFGGFSCDRPGHTPTDLPEAQVNDEPPATEAEVREAVFAGGCFWCVEAVFAQLDGVHEVISGYAGGTAETARYDVVSSGSTDHAEVVRVTYDPAKITYGDLLRVFFATHDPTQLNQQGPDHGRQYRSAVFYKDDNQRRIAEAYMEQLSASGVYDAPIMTTLEPLEAFYPAEQIHQDFVDRNPTHPYVRRWAAPKLEKVQTQFADQVRSQETE
ncbi:MAG: peptide-methionine (S)-S-oxide reductase MsrA [Phycisphaeraceae bacterium]